MYSIHKMLLPLVLTLATPLLARINTRTNIAEINIGSSAQRAGAFDFSINSDEFPDASAQTPVYLALQLDQNVLLCQTLVGPDQPKPIYLPIRLEGGSSNETIAAAPHTASIVRWVAGEDQIWIRILTSSRTWVNRESGLNAPDPSRPVAFTIGVSAEVSDDANISIDESASQFNANLPYQTRDPDAETSPINAVSIPLCMDLSASTLDPTPSPTFFSILRFDYTAWTGSKNVTAAPDPFLIKKGAIHSATFNRWAALGHGVPVEDCTAEINSLLVIHGGDDILLSREAVINCPIGFHTQSYFELEITQNQAGLALALDEFGSPILVRGRYQLVPEALAVDTQDWSSPSAHPDDVFIHNGRILARKARIEYTGTGTDTSFSFNFQATIKDDPNNPLREVRYNGGVTAQDSNFTSETYNLPGQEAFCSGPAQYFSIDEQINP